MVVKDAEEYYRCSVDEDINTWNIRDRHMFKVLLRLVQHAKEHKRSSKIIIWAHNSHVGDARHTDMGKMRSEINIGQLCRESGIPMYNIGFLCHEGTVMAANGKIS
jgi:erythromycin esterase-like protein